MYVSLLPPLLGGQPSLLRGLGRGSHSRLKQQQLTLSECTWHHRGGYSTWLGQHVGSAAFLLVAYSSPCATMGFPSLPSSPAVLLLQLIDYGSFKQSNAKLPSSPQNTTKNLLLISLCSVIWFTG